MKKLLIISFILLLSFSSFAESVDNVKDAMRFPTDNKLRQKDLSDARKSEYFTNNGTNETVVDLTQDVWSYTYNDEQTDSHLYNEIKNGEPYEERFEVMAGVPTKEDYTITWGADPLKVDYNGYVVKTKQETNHFVITLPQTFIPYFDDDLHYPGSSNKRMNHCQVLLEGPGVSTFEKWAKEKAGVASYQDMTSDQWANVWKSYVEQYFNSTSKENYYHVTHESHEWKDWKNKRIYY